MEQNTSTGKPTKQIGVGDFQISENSKKYVLEVLQSNRLSYGPFSRRLEKEFSQIHDCKFGILTNSGTSSLQIAIGALKEKYNWQDGDEILCPSVTFIASSNVILQNNMTPVFVDVEKNTYNINPQEIEKHITPKTKCIMVVHLYGQPCDMKPIMDIAKKHNLRIIEDSCETMFARYRGKSSTNSLNRFDNWNDGDEILCAENMPISLTKTITEQKLMPVFVKINPLTKQLDIDNLKTKFNARTRAILTSQEPSSEIEQFAKIHNVVIQNITSPTIEKGQSVGSFGDISCFSTYACHILVTGVGGITCTNDPELATLLRSLANHGRDNIYISMDDDKDKQGQELQEVINKRFSFIRMGYSYRVTELESAIGCGELERWETDMANRKKNAEALLTGMKKWEKYLQLPNRESDRDHSYMMFPLVIAENAPFTREEITLFLEENMIETRHMVSILDQPYYKELFGQNIENNYPVGKWINKCGFYIGCHPEITDENIQYILNTLENFFQLKNLHSEKETEVSW